MHMHIATGNERQLQAPPLVDKPGKLFTLPAIGQQLDRNDRQAMQTTSQNALERNPVGQRSTWNNPDSGHRGTVTPTRTYQTAAGQPCREYQQTVTIDGRTEKAYGQACRQADGSWRIVK